MTHAAASEWDADESEPVLDTTVASILRDAASRSPDTTALVEGVADPARRRRWTYAELLREAERVGSALSACLSPGARVAAVAPSLPESLVLTYGAALAGVVLVPVNPALRTEELRHVLGQSGARLAFTVAEHRGHGVGAAVDALAREISDLAEVVDFADWGDFLGRASKASPTRAVRPDDVAQLVYTSGTTGVPKGALLTHGGMTNAARFAARRFGMRDGDVYVHTMPLFHVGGQVVSFQLCQCSATSVLVHAFEPGLVLELLETERATLTCGVPTMLSALIEHPDFARRDLSTLRAVSGGGAVVPASLVRHIEDALGVQFAVVFGQTEASGFISQTHLGDADEDKGATLGQPLPRVAARVVGPDGCTVARGVVGELEVRGPNVMAGYHDLPEASAEAVGPDGWLRTGDLVTMDERGFLRMAGRRKEMIVSGGENIFPAEIEAVLAGHPDVADAAVVGVPDARWGEAVVGVVVPAAGRVPEPRDLEGYLRQRLAPFKVPRRWITVTALPRTASGKVQKHRIPLGGLPAR